MRILGLDPGLRYTGWGLIEAAGNRLSHVANGRVTSDAKSALAERLLQLDDGLQAVLADWLPDAAAVEETFVNKNPTTTLLLGQARGVALLAAARNGVAVHEYSPNLIKKSVVGTGHAAKQQIHAMVGHLLPACQITSADAADALAVAICHAHHAESRQRLARAETAMGARP